MSLPRELLLVIAKMFVVLIGSNYDLEELGSSWIKGPGGFITCKWLPGWLDEFFRKHDFPLARYSPCSLSTDGWRRTRDYFIKGIVRVEH